MRRYLFIIIGVVCALGIGHSVLAATQTDITQDVYNNSAASCGSSYPISVFAGQWFVPSKANINGIAVGFNPYVSVAATNTVEIYNDVMQLVYSTTTKVSVTNGDNRFYDIMFGQTVQLPYSGQYQIKLTNYDMCNLKIRIGTANPYSHGYFSTNALNYDAVDMDFKTYYDASSTLLFSATTSVSVVDDSNLYSRHYPYLSIPDKNYCYITGTTTGCTVKFSHNTYASGAQLTWEATDATREVPNGIVLATSTLSSEPYTADTITIPYTATTTPYETYCVYIHNPDGVIEDRMQCGWAIYFVKNTDQILASCNGSYNIGTACSDIASSTGGFDDLRYGIECGIRKFSYWAFTRSDQSCIDMMTAMSQVYTVFPVNVYVAVKDDIYSLSQISTTTASSTFRIPLLLPTGTHGTMQDTGLSLLKNDTISSSSLGTVWADINDKLSYFIYFLGFIWLVAELIGVSDNIYDTGGEIYDGEKSTRTVKEIRGQRIKSPYLDKARIKRIKKQMKLGIYD